MQRVIAELYADTIEGVVVAGTPTDGTNGDFDLDYGFKLRCDDGARFKVPGWAGDVTILEA